MQTFFGEEDYRAYLALLAEWTVRCGVRVLAYCLMPTRRLRQGFAAPSVHLVLVPATEIGLARAVGQTHQRYTRRVGMHLGRIPRRRRRPGDRSTAPPPRVHRPSPGR